MLRGSAQLLPAVSNTRIACGSFVVRVFQRVVVSGDRTTPEYFCVVVVRWWLQTMVVPLAVLATALLLGPRIRHCKRTKTGRSEHAHDSNTTSKTWSSNLKADSFIVLFLVYPVSLIPS